jgi:hypothetical protein
MNRKLTFKDYMKIFECSQSTAKRMIAKDRKREKKKHVTIRQILPHYGLDMLDVAPVLV